MYVFFVCMCECVCTRACVCAHVRACMHVSVGACKGKKASDLLELEQQTAVKLTDKNSGK